MSSEKSPPFSVQESPPADSNAELAITGATPSLRADAALNRTRILDAAREVFAREGIDAPVDAIARAAGVGIATLYRRFPQRPDLVAAAFEAKMAIYAEAAETGLADPDPWEGFCGFIREMASMQLADQGFGQVLIRTFPTAKRFEQARIRAYASFVGLIDRAKAAGVLRADFVAEDLIIALMANAGVVGASGDMAARTSPRLIAYLLQAFAAQRVVALPSAPSPAEMFAVLKRLDEDNNRSGP